MRILLTGSSGWLARFLVPRLESLGHEVTGFDVAPGPHTQIVASISERAAVDRAFEVHGIEAVIHAGALHKPDITRFPQQSFIDVNVTGTLNLLTAAVRAGHDRFVFTSTTSLMISDAIRRDLGRSAVWIDESMGPLEPRNIYGTTKLAAENLCRLHYLEHGLNCVVLRTARFFPEDDDTHDDLPGENLKANEFLYRRLTAQDAADIHIAALDQAPKVGFDILIASAPTPFNRSDVFALKTNAAALIVSKFPLVEALYAIRGWRLPTTIGRIYDASRAERILGYRCHTDFSAIVNALAMGEPLPFEHDVGYVSPSTFAVAPFRHTVD